MNLLRRLWDAVRGKLPEPEREKDSVTFWVGLLKDDGQQLGERVPVVFTRVSSDGPTQALLYKAGVVEISGDKLPRVGVATHWAAYKTEDTNISIASAGFNGTFGDVDLSRGYGVCMLDLAISV